MNEMQLQKLVEEISRQAFGMDFKHRAVFNHRLQTTGGRYRLDSHEIEVNPKMLAYGHDVLAGIIKHELCHYHLHLAGLGYRHKDRDFQRLLKKVGGSRYAPPAPKDYRYCYRCTNCQQLYYRKRRVNLDKYACSKCYGRLELIKQKN